MTDKFPNPPPPLDGDAFRERIALQNTISPDLFDKLMQEAEAACRAPLGRATEHAVAHGNFEKLVRGCAVGPKGKQQ